MATVPTAQLADRRKSRQPGIPTHLPMWKQVVVLSFWPMLEQLMNWLVWFVDTNLAGHIKNNEESLAAINAIGSGSYWVWLMSMILGAIGIGGAAIIARAIGGRRYRIANLVLGQTTLIAIVIGLVVGIIFTYFATFIGAVSNLTGLSYEMCKTYTQIVMLSSPAYGVLFTGAACLRSAGDFKTPFSIMVVVNIVNMLISWTLVNASAPYGGHGVMGIAIGTLVAWYIGAIIMLFVLARGHNGLKLQKPYFHFHRRTIKRVVKIGIPNMMENVGWWLGGVLILIVVGHVHKDAVGAHMVAIRLEGISFLPGYAMSMAVSTMVGQYLGAGDLRAAKKAVWIGWGYGATIMVLLGFTFMLFPEWWVRLVTDKEQIISEVSKMLFVAGWAQIGFATAMIMNGAMRGAGDTRTVMILSFVPLFLFRVPVVFYVGYVLGFGMVAIWTVLGIDLLLRGLVVFIRFLHGGWANARV